MKNNTNIGHDTDKAITKVGTKKSVEKPHRLKTEEPIAEKDEVKQAEDELRERMKKKSKLRYE